MVNFKEVGNRLISILSSRINDYIEPENLEAHSIENITRLASSIMMYKIWLNGYQSLDDQVMDLLMKKLYIKIISFCLAFFNNRSPNSLQTSFVTTLSSLISFEVSVILINGIIG